jgi:hypothetical protein
MDKSDLVAHGVVNWGSTALMAVGAYWIAGIPGICITLGFVVFIGYQREQLVEAIRARRS